MIFDLTAGCFQVSPDGINTALQSQIAEASTPASESERNFGMDAARAIAILLVLICHLGLFSLGIGGPADRVLYVMGFYGVELFFVLSGFLIGRILVKITEEHQVISAGLIRDFWLRRWFRTVPNYLLFLGLHWLSPSANLGIEYLFFCQNLAWPLSGSYPISWSLAVEEWFYFLLPVLALIFYRITRKAVRSIFCAAIVLFVFSAWMKWAFGVGQIWDSGVRKVVIYRFDSLMFGVLLAMIFLYRRRWFDLLSQPLCLVLNTVNFVILCGVSWIAHVSLSFEATHLNLLLFAWADVTFAVFLACLWNWRPVSFPLRNVVLLTSLLAYSLYLCHGPVMRALMRTPLRPSGPNDPIGALKVSIIGAACFAVAWVVYRYFEKPIMDLRHKLPGYAARTPSLTTV